MVDVSSVRESVMGKRIVPTNKGKRLLKPKLTGPLENLGWMAEKGPGRTKHHQQVDRKTLKGWIP